MTHKAYVHIGAAKSASKALQKHYFGAHPDLSHMGLGDGVASGWRTAELQRRVEVDLRCMKPLLYDAELTRAAWQDVLTHHADPTKRAGLSYENLSLTLGFDVDVTEKARRVRDMLGPETVVVLVIREQRALIRSCYAELLLNGLDLAFTDAVDHWLRGHVRSWISDLCFGRLVSVWDALFGPERVHVLLFDDLVDQPDQTLSSLSRALDVSDCIHTLPVVNERPTPRQLRLLLQLNRRMRHDLSDRWGSSFQADRFATHIRSWWPELTTDDAFCNAVLGRAAAHAIRSEGSPDGPELPLDFRPDQVDMLTRLFAADNRVLSQRLGRSLPDSFLRDPV